MTSSLDLSEAAALRPLATVVGAVGAVACETPLLLVGAAARDVLLVHVHGVEMLRATEDTDLALAVRDWATFLGLRKGLIDSGRFRPEGSAHRLWFGERKLDLIPFGGVERGDRSIVWPTEDAEVMNVLGFAEALATALSVRLPEGVSALVAPLPALALLKVWAWQDRKDTMPGKDASDLWVLLRHYSEAGNEERLFGSEGAAVLTAVGFEMDRAGAWLLGRDALAVLAQGPNPKEALATLERILAPEIDPDGPLRLVAQMPPGDRERQLALLVSFRNGLFDRGQHGARRTGRRL